MLFEILINTLKLIKCNLTIKMATDSVFSSGISIVNIAINTKKKSLRGITYQDDGDDEYLLGKRSIDYECPVNQKMDLCNTNVATIDSLIHLKAQMREMKTNEQADGIKKLPPDQLIATGCGRDKSLDDLKSKLIEEWNSQQIIKKNQISKELARLKSEIIKTIDAFDYSVVECIQPNILTPGFHDVRVDIRNLLNADLFTINCDYVNEVKMFAFQLNAMTCSNLASNLLEDIGLYQGLKTAADEGSSEVSVYEAGKLVLKDCIDSLGSDKDKVDIDSFTPAYKMLVQLCLHFLIELGMITQPGIASLQPSIILTMTRSFISCLLKAAIHRESDGEVNMRYGRGDNGSRMYDWIIMLNKWMLSISILEPLEICLNLITFNFVYHGDKVIRIPIESYKLVKYLTFYDLAKLVSRHIDFPFLFMSVTKIDTIWDRGNGSCYSIVTNEIQENEKLGKKDVCSFYLAEYVGADSHYLQVNRGYVMPSKLGILATIYIFVDKVNDIRVICKNTVGVQSILNRVAYCYPDTDAGAQNSAAIMSIAFKLPFSHRFIDLEKLIVSNRHISKTSNTPVDLLPVTASQESVIQTNHIVDVINRIAYQTKSKRLSFNPHFILNKKRLPEIIRIHVPLNSIVSMSTIMSIN